MTEATVVETPADDELLTIHQRMVMILGRLPAIGKDARNQQQNFMYRSHDAVLNALNPLLAEHGVFVVPNVLDRLEAQRTTKSGSVMYEVNLHVEYTFWGARGDSVVASAWGEGTDSGDKSTNKAMTMAFKNVIAQAFAVSTADTIDADSLGAEETVAKPREFDPGRDLLVNAISGDDFMRRLAEASQAVDPTIDWQQTIQPLISTVFGVATREEIPEARVPEFWRRLSNAIARLAPAGEGTFPAPPDEKIIDALAWAFQGATTVIVLNEPVQAAEDAIAAEAAQAAADDIPFGEAYGS